MSVSTSLCLKDLSLLLGLYLVILYFYGFSFWTSILTDLHFTDLYFYRWIEKKNSRSLFLQVCRYLRPLYFYRSELTCVYLIGISLQGLYLYKYIGLCFYRWLTFFFLSLLSLFQLLFFLNSKMRLAGVVCLRYFSAHFVDKHFFSVSLWAEFESKVVFTM